MSNANKTTPVFANGWISPPSGRGSSDILWSCLLTIFVCTWTALHLNLPSQDEKYWQIQLRRARWMVAAVLIPEVVMASAFAQRTAARASVKAMEAVGCTWTMRHAFFLNMGGVWLQPKDSKPFPINAAQLNYLVADGYMRLPGLSGKEIWDKSKADKFAKIFACGQIGWLVVQCVGRAIQNLPITPLEIATMSFAIPSLATYILWFHKPADVEVPTFFHIDDTTAEMLTRISPQKGYSWRQTPLDFIATVNSPSFTSEVILKSKRWPNRRAYVGPSNRIRNDVFALKYSILDPVCVSFVWVGFAGFHFSAWNFAFPSYAELVMWRAACLTMTGSMLVFWITSNRRFYMLLAYLWPWKRKQLQGVVSERAKVSTIQIMLGAVTGLAYLGARMCLIVLVFSGFRKMPVGVFKTVDWTVFLPHA